MTTMQTAARATHSVLGTEMTRDKREARRGLAGRNATAALVALTLLAGAAGAALALTPLPRRDPDRSVYDTAGVLDAGHVARMEAMHAELYRETGVAIVVIAVPALVDETIEDLAVRVGTEWGVGKRGEDRGVVVALARADRAVFIATGYGVEGYLPDGKVGAILDAQVLPHLREGDFSTGLYQASVALVAASAREYGVTIGGAAPQPAAEPPPAPGWLGLEWILRIVLGLVVLYLFIRHPRWLLFFLLARGGRRSRVWRGRLRRLPGVWRGWRWCVWWGRCWAPVFDVDREQTGLQGGGAVEGADAVLGAVIGGEIGGEAGRHLVRRGEASPGATFEHPQERLFLALVVHRPGGKRRPPQLLASVDR